MIEPAGVAVGEEASPFVGKLAGKPALVVVVTFAIATVATVALMLTGQTNDAAAVISILATIWALALALVIYLLTAKDTDKLLTHIDALQDQLAAALEAPGPQAVVDDQATIGQPVPSQVIEKMSDPTEAAPVAQSPDTGLPSLPTDYLDALNHRTGLDVSQIRRAWTPIPTGVGPWVIESDGGDRWSVFRGRRGFITVIPLGNIDRANQHRQVFDQRRAVVQAAKANRRGSRAPADHQSS